MNPEMEAFINPNLLQKFSFNIIKMLESLEKSENYKV
jgi:hypothetical protein